MTDKILFLGCNQAQLEFIRILSQQNFYIVGVDMNHLAPGRSFCDKFYNCGYDDIECLLEIGEEERFNSNDKVFTAAAQFAHLGAAHFAKSVGIKYPSVESIETCLDKTKFYRYFSSMGVPIPKTWFINDKKELQEVLNRNKSGWYWLKSDLSKNPNYTYRFNSQSIPFTKINWKKDRYLKKGYVLQLEHTGADLRINLYGERFNVFDFKTGKLSHKYHERIKDLSIVTTLRKLQESLNLQGWLIKFDVILQDLAYVVLDIGMDPPFRMRLESKRQEIDFEKYYIKHYLLGDVNYPLTLD